MHLHESALFDLHVCIRVKHNVAKNPLHHVMNTLTKFQVMSNIKGVYAFARKNSIDLIVGVKVTRDFAHYLLHCVTYAPAKFEVSMVYGMQIQGNSVKP